MKKSKNSNEDIVLIRYAVLVVILILIFFEVPARFCGGSNKGETLLQKRYGDIWNNSNDIPIKITENKFNGKYPEKIFLIKKYSKGYIAAWFNLDTGKCEKFYIHSTDQEINIKAINYEIILSMFRAEHME